MASAIKILGMVEIDGVPTVHCYPRDDSRYDKMVKSIYLRNIASQIVGEKSYNSIIDQAQMTPDGRFPCRLMGCKKTFW